MKQNGSFQETIARIGQRIKSSRKRYFGVLLILLGLTIVIHSFKSYAKSERNSENA